MAFQTAVRLRERLRASSSPERQSPSRFCSRTPHQHARQRDLGSVRQKIGQHAPAERRAQRDGPAVFRVDEQEPGRSEGVAQQDAEGHAERQRRQTAPEAPHAEPDRESREHKANEIAARRAEHRADPALEAREHRRADRGQQQIAQHRPQPEAQAEQPGQKADRKGLHRKGHGRGDREPGADGDQRRAHGGRGQIPRREALSHAASPSFPPRFYQKPDMIVNQKRGNGLTIRIKMKRPETGDKVHSSPVFVISSGGEAGVERSKHWKAS